MKKNYLIALMAAASMAVSCSNEAPGNESVQGNVINIEASVSPQTRTPQLGTDGSGNFTDGDIISLFIAGEQMTTISTDYKYHSTLLTWDNLKLPENTSQVTFAGCYPQAATTDGTFEFNILTADNKDLLLAPAQSVKAGTADPIHLSFGHALHLLNLNFTAGTGYSSTDLQDLKITCHAKTTCVVDAAKGSIKETKATTGDINATGATASLYLIPQATDGITLSVTINGETKTVTLKELLQQLDNSQTTLQGGKSCTLTLKVNRNGITIEDATIGAWGNQVTTEGEIVIG